MVNPQTGLAISGFDPVTYFTNSEAKFGRPDLEFAHLGGIWRFQNTGNRAAFIANPDVYMPRFGGYDPVGVAQGKPVPGDPLYWAIRKNQLYLFYSAQTRAQFSADPDNIAAEAGRRWPDVQHALTP